MPWAAFFTQYVVSVNSGCWQQLPWHLLKQQQYSRNRRIQSVFWKTACARLLVMRHVSTQSAQCVKLTYGTSWKGWSLNTLEISPRKPNLFFFFSLKWCYVLNVSLQNSCTESHRGQQWKVELWQGHQSISYLRSWMRKLQVECQSMKNYKKLRML